MARKHRTTIESAILKISAELDAAHEARLGRIDAHFESCWAVVRIAGFELVSDGDIVETIDLDDDTEFDHPAVTAELPAVTSARLATMARLAA